MWAWRLESKASLIGSALLLCSPWLCNPAQADNASHHNDVRPTHFINGYHHHAYNGATQAGSRHVAFAHTHGKRRYAGIYGSSTAHGISCVPYARQVSGIMLVGNAWQWWGHAAGEYARGQRPETGSILAFRPNGRMHLGHVAVVRQVVNPREIYVDQANWPSDGPMGGRVSHHVAVVDVSEANNWSAVRVQLGTRNAFGSVYPTYGFIYNRPDFGVVTAAVDRPAPQPDINPVPSDLRPKAERPWRTVVEVADLPSAGIQNITLQISDPAVVEGN